MNSTSIVTVVLLGAWLGAQAVCVASLGSLLSEAHRREDAAGDTAATMGGGLRFPSTGTEAVFRSSAAPNGLAAVVAVFVVVLDDQVRLVCGVDCAAASAPVGRLQEPMLVER